MNQLLPLVNIWGPFDPETIWDVLGTQGQPGTTGGFSSNAQKSQPSIVETARRRRKETLEAAFHRKSRVLCGQFADPVSSGPGACHGADQLPVPTSTNRVDEGQKKTCVASLHISYISSLRSDCSGPNFSRHGLQNRKREELFSLRDGGTVLMW